MRMPTNLAAIAVATILVSTSLPGAGCTGADFEFESVCSDRTINVDTKLDADNHTPPDFKVAFIGDSGMKRGAKAVLRLIKNRGVDMVLHQGDMSYGKNAQDATRWDAMVTRILGANYPYFASVGNHDAPVWSIYQKLLTDRLHRVPEAECTGNYGVDSACTYRGLFFLLSRGSIGGNSSASARYVENEMRKTTSLWRICSWHLTRHEL